MVVRHLRRPRAQKPGPCYVAIIADMVDSRALRPAARAGAQVALGRLMAELNEDYGRHLASKFVVTLGDEFQGIARTGEIIPSLVWQLELRFTARPLRLGFGFGEIFTAINEYAINLDGPALHNARAALDRAKKENLRGGVFAGFRSAPDASLNGFARLLHHQRATWPRRQRQVVEALRRGMKGTETAAQLRITKQAVSLYSRLAGWAAYAEAEQGWLSLLRAPLAED